METETINRNLIGIKDIANIVKNMIHNPKHTFAQNVQNELKISIKTINNRMINGFLVWNHTKNKPIIYVNKKLSHDIKEDTVAKELGYLFLIKKWDIGRDITSNLKTSGQKVVLYIVPPIKYQNTEPTEQRAITNCFTNQLLS